MFVFRAVIHKMFVRIANREDPDQTLEAVRSESAVCESRPIWQASIVFEILEHYTLSTVLVGLTKLIKRRTVCLEQSDHSSHCLTTSPSCHVKCWG